jgi:amidohydrolase
MVNLSTTRKTTQAVMVEKIQSFAKEYLDEIIRIRRHIHAHPELSFHEKETAAFVVQQLNAWGISATTGIGGYGITAFIEGKNPSSRCYALRADMDALPIVEKNDTTYKSQHDGVMHACGHDVHTASLLGAAKILNTLKSEWEGTVQLIFQPAEEVLPGGASLMIKDGVFSKRKPDAIFGQHVFPELPAGKVGFRKGAYMASTDEIYITITGKGGHGAKPDQVVDPVLISAHLLVALQQVVARWANPQMPTVLSFGKINANGATNIIPSELKLEGTFRTFNEKWRYEAHERMKALAKGLVEGMGGEVDFRIEVGYPVVFNNPEVTEKAMLLSQEYLGENNVVPLDMRTTAEDFAYYSQLLPGCFYRLGTAAENGKFSHPVHHPQFDVNEDALLTGMGLMAWLAIKS